MTEQNKRLHSECFGDGVGDQTSDSSGGRSITPGSGC